MLGKHGKITTKYRVSNSYSYSSVQFKEYEAERGVVVLWHSVLNIPHSTGIPQWSAGLGPLPLQVPVIEPEREIQNGQRT